MKEAITLSGVLETMLQPVYARAMLKNAPVIILDEATAYIDPENEAVIQKTVARLVANKTVIVIAHRLSTITGADNIAVVSGGRIAAQGRHEELIAQPGIYADSVGGSSRPSPGSCNQKPTVML